jgi:hypothetical protein
VGLDLFILVAFYWLFSSLKNDVAVKSGGHYLSTFIYAIMDKIYGNVLEFVVKVVTL